MREQHFYAQVGTKVGGESHFDVRLVYARERISNMPEPNAQGQMTITKGESLPDFNSPQFIAAATKCRKLESGGGGSDALSPSQIAEQLKFAQCMRANGISNFPDPLSKGGLL